MRMFPFLRNPGDTIIPLEPWRKVVADGFDLAKRPDACAVWLQDLLPATRFRDQYRREKGVPLTYPPMLIRACALALDKYSTFHSSIWRGKLVIPSSIDIGITSAGQEVLAPVIVIRNANTKSLQEIVTEIREKARQARTGQRRDLDRLNWVGRWVPSLIRRRLVRWAVRSPTFWRTYVGTFQITVLSDLPGFAVPGFLSTTFMMGMGGVARRPIVVDNQLEIRPTVHLSLAGDHRLTEGRQALLFMQEVQDLLLNPGRLDS